MERGEKMSFCIGDVINGAPSSSMQNIFSSFYRHNVNMKQRAVQKIKTEHQKYLHPFDTWQTTKISNPPTDSFTGILSFHRKQIDIIPKLLCQKSASKATQKSRDQQQKHFDIQDIKTALYLIENIQNKKEFQKIVLIQYVP